MGKRMFPTGRKTLSVAKVARQGDSAGIQKGQIMSLTRQLSSLKHKRMADLNYTSYQIEATENCTSAYNVWDMGGLDGWTRRFGPPPAGQAMMRKLEMDVQFVINNEAAPVTFSVFLVSLKGATAAQLQANASANLTGLDENVHYTRGPASSGGHGLVHINRDFFNIHKSSRFQISGTLYDTAASYSREASSSVKRIAWDVNFKRRLISGRGVWDPTVSAMPQDARMYLLIFNDNSGADGEYPVMAGNAMWHVTSS